MKDTKIRWADNTWNPMTGCTKISAECENCYAETLTLRWAKKDEAGNVVAHSTAFPTGFVPTFKPERLNQPTKWQPGRVFVNSMSDIHHADFLHDQVRAVYDVMAADDRHDWLVLTKRPKRMRDFAHRWLDETGRDEVPAHIWLGTSIGLDRYTWRANHLRDIPVPVRFLSCEPLLGPLPSLDLDGIGWVIAGGESGPGWRPMDHEWARDLRDRTWAAEAAFFFKQSAAPRTEMGIELDGMRHEEYPFPHPGDGLPRVMGRYTGRSQTVLL